MIRSLLRTCRVSSALVVLPAFAIATILAVSPASAQGGRGGGRSGGASGGRGGGLSGPSAKSPADLIRENLDNDNPLKFLLDHRKPLELTNVQRDSLEQLRDELKDMQKPIFKEIETELKGMPSLGRGAGGGGGGMGGEGRGGSGGPPSGGGSGGSGGSGGRGARGEGGAGRGMAMLPDTVRALVNRLADIQSAFGDRGRAQLTASQRTSADSLHTVWLEEQRKKDEARRKLD